MSDLWTAACAGEVEADWLLRAIAPAGDFGRRRAARERPFQRGDEQAAAAAIARVARVAGEVSAEALASIQAAIAACPDPGAALARARSALPLADADLFELTRFIDAVSAVRRDAQHASFAEIAIVPALDRLAGLLARGRTPARGFYMADEFDGRLARARADARALRARYDAERSRIAARVAAFAGIEHVRDGEFVLMRDRVAGPLPPDVRVLREAPTYWLCELTLDPPALAALAALEQAEARVGEREDAVRLSLAATVRDDAGRIDAAVDALGALDCFVARVRFACSYDGCVPEIPGDAALSVVDARFLPLAATLASRGHRYAPVSLALDGVGVLTGPNMGGKSAALRTCGFVAVCVALGLPAPAREARVGLFDEIAWIGSGADQDRTSLLSSFGSEVVQLRDFLARDRPRALVLVDEFARTTTPREGRALVIALLQRLRARDATGLVATHLSGIAEDAGVAHFAVAGLRALPSREGGEVLDLDAAIERIAAVMDYRVHRVERDAEPRADAIALADVLGLDAEVVARARAAL